MSDLTPHFDSDPGTAVKGSHPQTHQTDARTIAKHFDDNDPPPTASVKAGWIVSRSLGTNGEVFHVRKEATGASSAATFADLVVQLAAVVWGSPGSMSLDATDSAGRRVLRPRTFILDPGTGGFFYLDDDLNAVGIGVPSIIRDRIAASEFVIASTSPAVMEEVDGTNGPVRRVQFPDGVESEAVAWIDFALPQQQFSCRLWLFLWTSAASGNASITIGYRDIRPGDDIDAADDGTIGPLTWTTPGAGKAGVLATDITDLFRIESGYRSYRLRVTRAGDTDSLNAPLYLLGLRWQQRSQAEELAG